MAWEQVSQSNTFDIKKEVGKHYVGVFQGFKKITTKIGEQIIWLFEDDGIQFGIYGFTMLNFAMQSVHKGMLCRVTYTGKKNVKTKFGMKDVHQATVEVDKDASPLSAWEEEDLK